ncbi:MAG: hypothetical protein R3E39_09660 [Anaerolineae bacterium]
MRTVWERIRWLIWWYSGGAVAKIAEYVKGADLVPLPANPAAETEAEFKRCGRLMARPNLTPFVERCSRL